MQLKLVYRILRKISDWTVGGFYAEVYVEGQENVPPQGPLVIASTHHNEIIDIATLAITIPHRRHLSFWAKSTLFKNPVVRSILLSSGAIPVRRNPNNANGKNDNDNQPRRSGHVSADDAADRSELFRETSSALAEGEVVGVFPEGTSYTQPGIVQILPGAAWAAVDFVDWCRTAGYAEDHPKQVSIVPVGIIYTNKSQYQSRVIVRYGKPINVNAVVDGIAPEAKDEGYRLAVKTVMAEIEQRLHDMTINAPDWDTLYSSRVTRDMLWGEEKNIPLRDWVLISQALVDLFAPKPSKPSQDVVKETLIRYCALLVHSGISHSDLALAFDTSTHQLRWTPFLVSFPATLIRLVFFLPPVMFHIPAYVTGSLALRLAPKGEEESQAQFKGIGGGIGLGLGMCFTLAMLKSRWSDWVWDLAGRYIAPGPKRVAGVLATFYSTFYLLIKWHNLLVRGNYKRFREVLTFWKVVAGFAFSRRISSSELEPYFRPPPPPPNPFIKKNNAKASPLDGDADSLEHKRQASKPASFRQLVAPLLQARMDAFSALAAYMNDQSHDERTRRLVQLLKEKGASIPGAVS